MYKTIIGIVLCSLLIRCSIIDSVLDCDENEIGFELVNNTSENKINVTISVVKFYADSLEILETESYEVLKGENRTIPSSTKWKKEFEKHYRDIDYYQGIYTSTQTRFFLLIQRGSTTYYTYSASYDQEGYCESCGKACVTTKEGYDSSIVYFEDDKITSDILTDSRKRYEYPFK